MSGNFSEEDIQKEEIVYIDWGKDFLEFIKKMRSKIIRNLWKKGYPTKDKLKYCSDVFLIEKLKEHLDLKHYSDVANYAFMLYQKNGEKEV